MAQAKRRLAAILAADVAGYSRLMGDDERATMDMLNACRQVFRGRITDHDGRVVDTSGDSILAVFGSVVEAVECAVEVQLDIGERNSALPQDRQMLFRIGVNLGDVFEQDDGTVYGDGVNVAARLESLSEPGGVTLSEEAYRQVEGKTGSTFRDIGTHEIKNIARPVHAFAINADTTAAAPASLIATTSEDLSIAALPFDNLSHDPDQEFFADGITEDILTNLARFKDLTVVGRNSSFRYKGQSVDIRRVGRELGVQYVLEGSVRKAGTAIRVSAQLLDTTDASHVWADTFDRSIDGVSIFDVQDEIAHRVATIIANPFGVLVQQRVEHIKQLPPDALTADQCVMLANAYYLSCEPVGHYQARERLLHVLGREPDNPNLLSMLCHLCIDEYAFSHNALADPLDRALDAGRSAVAAQPNSDRTRMALSRAHLYRGELEAYQTEAEKVLKLNPNSAHRLAQAGQHYVLSGDWEQGMALVEKGFALDPFMPSVFGWPLFLGHYRQADYEAALAAALRLAMPRFWMAQAFAAAAYGQLGRESDAQRTVAHLLEVFPDFAENARETVRRAIRLEELTDGIIEGLLKAGLNAPD